MANEKRGIVSKEKERFLGFQAIFSWKLNIRGGRYDSLIKDLGFKKNIPAVGAAINLEKI